MSGYFWIFRPLCVGSSLRFRPDFNCARLQSLRGILPEARTSRMDIYKWLSETRNEPEGQTDTDWKDDLENGEHAESSGDLERIKRATSKKACTSDSSILLADHHSAIAQCREGQEKAQHHADRTIDEGAIPASASSVTSRSSRQYKRRARRKTRPDRYELKTCRERGDQREKRTTNAKRGKRTKSDGKGGGRNNTSRTYYTRPKNVTSERLTVLTAPLLLTRRRLMLISCNS